MRETRTPVLLWIVLLGVFLVTPAAPDDETPNGRELKDRFADVVQGQPWSRDVKDRVLAAFDSLGSDLQQVLVSVVEGLRPRAAARDPEASSDESAPCGPRARLPYICAVEPDSGDASPGGWVVLTGQGFDASCEVFFKENRETEFVPWGDGKTAFLGFRIPDDARLGHNYDLYVVNGQATGNRVKYHAAAPRGVRGVNGWGFQNFVTGSDRDEGEEGWIPKEVFWHYFRIDELRRESCNQYYKIYKRIGWRGNCLGMTLRALRASRGDFRSIHEEWWKQNRKRRTWDYTRSLQVEQSINEDQGAQTSAEFLDKFLERRAEDNNAAWERCKELLDSDEDGDRPVLLMRQEVDGEDIMEHAVLPYETLEKGDERIIRLYDSNTPYKEDEGSNPTEVAVVTKKGEFRYQNYNRAMVMSFAECVPEVPHLPTSPTGMYGYQVTLITVDRPARVKQIEDDSGRFFYDGPRINEDPRTRIPGSMLFVPIMGPQAAADFPSAYLFQNAGSRNLKFTLDDTAGCHVRYFAPWLIYDGTSSASKAALSFEKALPSEPSSVTVHYGVSTIRSIVIVDRQTERVAEVTLPAHARDVGFRPGAGLKKATIENRGGTALRYDLMLKSYGTRGPSDVTLKRQELPAGNSDVLTPKDWMRLREGGIGKKTFRNLQ